jgi:hypothetical protein
MGFWTPLLRKALLLFGVTLAASPSPVELHSVILSTGWPIKKAVMNRAGDIALAGGEFLGGADGLLRIDANGIVKLLAAGDAVPGDAGLRFGAVEGEFALNDRGQIVATARVVQCGASEDITACAKNTTQLEGLFLLSENGKETIALQGDRIPGSGDATFRRFDRTLINDQGLVVFQARFVKSDGSEMPGLFSFSNGRTATIYAEDVVISPAFLNDDGLVTFSTFDRRSAVGDAIHQYQNGSLSQLIRGGDPAPGGGVFGRISEMSVSRRGEIVFHSGFTLYLRGTDGTVRKVVQNADPTPFGGQFALTAMVSLNTVSVTMAPRINASRDVAFVSPVRGAGSANVGIFLSRGGVLEKVAVNGDLAAGGGGTNLTITTQGGQTRAFFSLNDLGMVAFSTGITGTPGVSALHLYLEGNISKLVSPGDSAPGAEGESFTHTSSLQSDDLQPIGWSDSGEIAFRAPICCGTYTEGIFKARLPRAEIPNGDFETPGSNGLSQFWQTAWTTSGTGESYGFAPGRADAFRGASVLRLHVGAGGGSTFVLSDPIPVAANAAYVVTSELRYYLQSADDAVYFSVLQYDAAGNEVGFDQVASAPGDNAWTWLPKGLLIRTTSTTASIRVRFGLRAATEAYLDVDYVQ